jgi:hypothetical protein
MQIILHYYWLFSYRCFVMPNLIILDTKRFSGFYGQLDYPQEAVV